jgi:fatty-acyl-CoA synthase
MLSTMMQTPLTVPLILDRAAKLFGQREIVSRLPDRSIVRMRYHDLVRRAWALAEGLSRAGLKPGDRVATLMWNTPAHLEAYFGIPIAGGVLHTLNLRLHPDQIAWIANDADDRFVIVDESLLPTFDKCPAKGRFQRVYVVRHSEAPLPPGYESYESLLATATGDFTPPPIDEAEACGLCYTSGTTGNPKGVAYSHRSMVLHSLAISLADTLALAQRETVLPVVPMFHVNAWGIPYGAIMVGAKLVLPGPHLDPVSLLELFEQEKVTLTAGVPTIWLGILAALDKEPARWKLQRMRMIVGGSAAPESLIRGFDRHGQEVLHAWGMTETSPVGTVGRLTADAAAAGEAERYATRAKQGIPAPLVDVRIMADGSEAPWDGKSMGELQVRGPWVAGSYFGASADPDKFTADGWFRTGDVATMDPLGYMKITDRTKDLIKSGGEWISSVELENALMGHPAVREACVVAVPHPKWAERPLAVVVFKEGASATPETLRAYLAPKFPKWWLPEAIDVVTEIPKTSAGKFLKSAVREKYAGWTWSAEG